MTCIPCFAIFFVLLKYCFPHPTRNNKRYQLYMELSTSPPSITKEGKLHIAIFPWLAFGHMIPYFELSKLIAQKGHKISFISTPKNINRLPKIPPNLVPFINFVKIPLPAVDNLPENVEATSDLPYDKVKYLKIAYDGLKEPVTHFLETSSPDWVFYDFAPFWLAPIASNLNISTAFFSIFIAASMVFWGSSEALISTEGPRTKPEDFVVPPSWIPFETNVAFKMFEILRIFGHSLAKEDDNITDAYRLGVTLRDCDIVAIRGCTDFDGKWLQVLENIHRKPVIPVGQLPTTAYDSGDKDDEWTVIKEWLDEQAKGTVVYVAFGSEAKPSQAELTEMALGLELSGLPFFWVLRKQLGLADPELLELPDGFEERTKGRGVVCTSWAPQLKILSHDSVGGFLTHCGWSSVVEAMQFERPLVLLAFLVDQGLISRVLEEKRLGYSIPRNELDGSFTRDSVAESLQLVVLEEEGKIYRDNAKEMRGLFGDLDQQDKYVNNLLGYLQTHGSLRS